MSKTDYTREELIGLCEKASVQEHDWSNRDSAEAQMQIGKCLMLLKAGCEFVIWTEGDEDADTCITDEDTIWVNIKFKGFAFFEGDMEEKEHFYIPTKKRVGEGGDWY